MLDCVEIEERLPQRKFWIPDQTQNRDADANTSVRELTSVSAFLRVRNRSRPRVSIGKCYPEGCTRRTEDVKLGFIGGFGVWRSDRLTHILA